MHGKICLRRTLHREVQLVSLSRTIWMSRGLASRLGGVKELVLKMTIKQAFIFILAFSLLLFVVVSYPSYKLKKMRNEANFVIVNLIKDSDKWVEMKSGPFCIRGNKAKEFVNNLFSSAKIDDARFATKLRMEVHFFDGEKSYLGSAIFRNDYEYSFDPIADPKDDQNPIKELFANTQSGVELTESEFRKHCPPISRRFQFSVNR